MRKVRGFFEDYGVYLFVLMVAVIMVVLIIHAFVHIGLTEGMVMNKWASQIYSCSKEGCEYQDTKFIVAVQNGEVKDWWQVTMEYYESVEIGNWVKK